MDLILEDGPLLRVENLSVSFGRPDALTPIVHGVSFDIRAGECFGLVGETGSGKSVTGLSIAGLRSPHSGIQTGRVSIGSRQLPEARDTAAMRAWRRDEVGVIFQSPTTALNPRLSVREQLIEALPRATPRGERTRQARELLDRVGVPRATERLDAFPRELSGGLAQRVMIAMALARGPRVLIADEPTTALDVRVQRHILDLIDELRQDLGLAVLLISHDIGVVGDRADRLGVLRSGHLVESGDTARILTAPADPYTRALIEANRVEGAHTAAAPTGNEPPREPLLEVRDLTKRFRRAPRRGPVPPAAVDSVSLSIGRGESVAIVGESGSGKTTLARMITGLTAPTSGALSLAPQLGIAPANPRIARAQYVFQDQFSSLDPRWSVAAQLSEPLKNRGISGDALPGEIGRLLGEVALDPALATRYPAQLSGGQRQRVGIARALASEPDFLVADEPVSALDALVRAEVVALLDRLRRERHMTLVLITHDLSIVSALSERVVVMRDGRIVEDAPTHTVLTSPTHPYTRELLEAIPGTRIAALNSPHPLPER
ncbi:ABC transporter ATP-binding protein [Mycetocola tolaasinivorans]|uniref:ABC transporter ATP-binding protein n=1 Tax=Mycetocola tolaasinivorans TaxID=76635 RepID=A0A3L7AC13_9MICO|nr:ABC transporter ATP-binding protein [Mycetocola tolaasinivorans]RLP77524.1 ABC transporter ATP-binding protein [Mycetocola tolaasinivorans]